MTGTLRERLERMRSALPGPSSSVTLTREDLDALLGHPDEIDPVADLTVAQVAEETGRAVSTIRTWLGRGDIPGAYRLHGREWRIPRSALREYLRRGGQAGATDPELEGAGDLSAWRRAS